MLELRDTDHAALQHGHATPDEEAYADLPGTDPTVWMNIRNGEVPPRTYRVVRAERCEPAADECDGRDLYRLEFRPNSE
jgi:hypothetical protein